MDPNHNLVMLLRFLKLEKQMQAFRCGQVSKNFSPIKSPTGELRKAHCATLNILHRGNPEAPCLLEFKVFCRLQ